jgi:hypothetical protein
VHELVEAKECKSLLLHLNHELMTPLDIARDCQFQNCYEASQLNDHETRAHPDVLNDSLVLEA